MRNTKPIATFKDGPPISETITFNYGAFECTYGVARFHVTYREI